MDTQSTAPATNGAAPRVGPSSAPRWTLLRRVHVCQHDRASEVVRHLVGVRDQESGQSRIFMVYHSAPGAAQDAEPPPDPDPPPAAPAQARPRTEPGVASEDNSSDWPCARAA